MIGRREFLASAYCLLMDQAARRAGEPRINTVSGQVSPAELGVTLMHEHLMVDFAGARAIARSRYDPEEVFRTALPHLNRIRGLGCGTLVDCTPAYIGRDAALLRRLSLASGVKIVTNTGYYAAGEKFRYLPELAFTETAVQLARRWISEWRDGIGVTGIRPGLIKIGVTQGRLSDLECKIVRAAALAHKSTGLPVGSHTGDGTAALHQLEIFADEGVRADAFIWMHAQNENDAAAHVRAAREGAWLEFDGVSETTAPRDVELVRNMIAAGFLGRTLISQDAGWYHVGEASGGTFRGFDFLLTGFTGALRTSGVSQDQVRTLLRDNPQAALTSRG